MTRRIIVSAAQLGPVPLTETRPETLARLIKMLETAAADGTKLVVFPEAALTPFFPHWLVEDADELDTFYENTRNGLQTTARSIRRHW
ncbi:hypothetical protein J7I86_20380 [Arthrobacter sp. ISL-95]|nr:hypothetical protein [Arthrobacter sp. ISL-95]